MRRILVLTCFSLLLSPALLATENAPTIHQPYLSAGERADLLAQLEETRHRTLSAVAGLTDAAFHYKPAPDRWSVAEVVEHLVLSEGAFRERIHAILDSEPNPDWAEQTAGQLVALRRTVLDRSNKFPARDVVQPRGGGERRELLERYEKARAGTLTFVNEHTQALKAHTVDNQIFGVMNAYQWLNLVALHNQRHNQQIADLLADPELPR